MIKCDEDGVRERKTIGKLEAGDRKSRASKSSE